MAMATTPTSGVRSAWINSKVVSTRLRLSPAPRSTLSKLMGQDKPIKSCCLLQIIGRGTGQGIIAYCEDTNQLVLFTNHHIIHSNSKACVTRLKISVGSIKEYQLSVDDFTTYISCCGPDGLLGQNEHPEQKCLYGGDFTALVININQAFAMRIISSNLQFPTISSSDIDLLNRTGDQSNPLILMRYGSPEPIQLENIQNNRMISKSDVPLSTQVNVYQQLRQLKYCAANVGGGNSGGGVFIEESSDYWLVGLHKSTQTDEEHERTDEHSGIAIHFILHALFCKDKRFISDERVVQKLNSCIDQLVLPYLSLILDLKMKGRLLGIKQDNIYECVQLCVEVLARIVPGAPQLLERAGKLVLEIFSFFISNDVLFLKSAQGRDAILPSLKLITSILKYFSECTPGLKKVKGMIGELYPGEAGNKKFYDDIRHIIGYQVYDNLGVHGSYEDVMELCFVCWQHLRCLPLEEHTGVDGCKPEPVRQYWMRFRKFEEFANDNKSNIVVDTAFRQIKSDYESWEAKQSLDDSGQRYECNLDGIELQKSNKVPNPIVRDFEGLSKRDRLDLLAEMNKLTEQINNKFLECQDQILKSVEERSQDISLSRLKWSLHHAVRFTEKEKTVGEACYTISKHCSYFNFGPLETIVKVHKLDNGPLEHYSSEFSKYCRAMPCVETVCGSNTSVSGRYEVIFKVKGNRDPKSILSIRSKIAGILGINTSALCLLFVKNGCVLLEFLVPDFIVESSFSFFEDKQIIALHSEVGIISITIHYPHGDKIVDVEAETKRLLKPADQVVNTTLQQLQLEVKEEIPKEDKGIDQEMQPQGEDRAFESLPELQQALQVSQKPAEVQTAEAKLQVKAAQVQETTPQQQKYEEVPKEEKVKTSQEVQPEEGTEIEKEGSPSEPGSLQQPIQMSSQPIMSLDTHGKKKHEISEDVQELKITHKRKGEAKNLEPEEIKQKLMMIHRELHKESVFKARWEAADVGEEAKKLKFTLENIDQHLQEIVAQRPALEIIDRTLQLTEETQQLLEKGEGRPREGLQEDIQKVNRELEENIEGVWVNPSYSWRQSDVDQLWRTRQTLEDLFLCLPKRTAFEELFIKVDYKLTLLECDPHPFVVRNPHYLLRKVSHALEDYQRIMGIEEHFQKMSIQRKEEEVQTEVQSTEKKEKTFGHTEHSHFKLSELEYYQQNIKERHKEIKTELDRFWLEIHMQAEHLIYPSRIRKMAKSGRQMRLEEMKGEQTPPQVEKFKKHTTAMSQHEDTISSEGGTKIKSITELNVLQWEDTDKMRQEQERKQQVEARFEGDHSKATESLPELGSLQQVSHEPVKVQAAEEKYQIKPAQVQETASQQLKYEDKEEVPKEEKVKTSQETQPEEGTEIEKEGSPSEPGLLQLIQMSSQPIMSLDTHGKKKHEISEDVQELKISQKRKEEAKKLEPKEIEQKLEMIHRELHKELSKARWKAADVGEEVRETKRKEIYQKLKLTLENIDQDLQELVAQRPALEIIDRTLQLIEETLQLLEKGEGRPREGLQEDIQKVDRELKESIRKDVGVNPSYSWRQLDVDQQWRTRQTLEDLFLCLPKQTGLEELFVKVEDKITLLECHSYPFMMEEAYYLLREVSYALEHYQRTMEHFQKMSIQRKEEEVQSEEQSTEKKEKIFGHTEHSYFELSWLRYQQKVKRIQEEIQKELDRFWFEMHNIMRPKHLIYPSIRDMAKSGRQMRREEMKGEQTPPQVEKFKKYTTVMSQHEDTISSEGGTKSLRQH